MLIIKFCSVRQGGIVPEADSRKLNPNEQVEQENLPPVNNCMFVVMFGLRLLSMQLMVTMTIK